jgi:hypothetical protein
VLEQLGGDVALAGNKGEEPVQPSRAAPGVSPSSVLAALQTALTSSV